MIDSQKAQSIENSILQCLKCQGLAKNALQVDNKEVGLSYSYPQSTPIHTMFVAESPPAPGKGFFYDLKSHNTRFRDKLFRLINTAGLGRVNSIKDFNDKGYYLADALNCRWDKSQKSSLSSKVFQNCSVHLARQIELFKPRYIVAMGRSAQKSLGFDEPTKIIRSLAIPRQNIIEMSFILVAPNETDGQRINKLSTISSNPS